MPAITKQTLDELFSAMPTGSLDRAILHNLRGINHRQIPGMVPSNRDQPGYTFFTRPQLNMQSDNIRNVRQLSRLMTNQSVSIQAYIRHILDPRYGAGFSVDKMNVPGNFCPLVINDNPFIPILTNNLLSISGWPSVSIPTFTSKAGLFNEAYSMVDGLTRNFEVFDISCTFRNTRGDPIVYLFYVWGLYMSAVFQGQLMPYLDFITNNRIDYNTRIYRLTMDYNKRHITKIACTHASFPIGIPIGDFFDINGNQPFSEANKEFTMQFRCHGVDYFDDIVPYEFNKVIEIFNPMMKDGVRQSAMYKIPNSVVTNFNNRGYPYINMYTAELEWWVSLEEYAQVSSSYLESIAGASGPDGANTDEYEAAPTF